MFRIKRVYDPPSPEDGVRILVDRLWPRGLSKENASLQEWMRDIAPSDELRKWFSHKPEKWEEFKLRYFKELDGKKELLSKLRALGKKGTVTLLYSTKSPENNAVALLEYLKR